MLSLDQKLEIGVRARAERKAQKKRQGDIAAVIGCTPTTIVEVEKGGSFSERLLRDLAAALNVSEHWLLTGSGAKHTHREIEMCRPPMSRFHRHPLVRESPVSYTTMVDVERFIAGASQEEVLKISERCVKELAKRMKGETIK